MTSPDPDRERLRWVERRADPTEDNGNDADYTIDDPYDIDWDEP
ncbi:hypothetical protein [Corynebacterium lujinxingii]|nr:hypothetical protein [Corynebacterium lujinxingii]